MRSATARATVSSPKMGTLAGGTLSGHHSLLAPFNNRTAPPTHYVQGVSKQQDDMAALSAQESKRAADIAKYVEQIPAAVVTEMLERVLNHTGEDDQRKVRMGQMGQNSTPLFLPLQFKASPMDAWVLVHPGSKKVHYPRAASNSALGASSCCVKRAPLPNVHKASDDFRFRRQIMFSRVRLVIFNFQRGLADGKYGQFPLLLWREFTQPCNDHLLVVPHADHFP